MDPSGGTLLSPDRSDPSCLDLLHDFTITSPSPGRYVMLYSPVFRTGHTEEAPVGVFLSASGFACSNFLDDDGDGDIDWGMDDGCLSPSDDSE